MKSLQFKTYSLLGASLARYNDYYDYSDYDLDDIEDAYNEYMEQQALYNQEWAKYVQNLNNWYWQMMLQNEQRQYAAIVDAYNEYDDDMYYADSDDKDEGGGEGGVEENFGISEASIMQKAESEAKKHVIEKMEKRMESRLEKEMLSKLNRDGAGDGVVHKKSKSDFVGEDMDAEHSGMPLDEEEEEDTRRSMQPRDSLSDSQ